MHRLHRGTNFPTMRYFLLQINVLSCKRAGSNLKFKPPKKVFQKNPKNSNGAKEMEMMGEEEEEEEKISQRLSVVWCLSYSYISDAFCVLCVLV